MAKQDFVKVRYDTLTGISQNKDNWFRRALILAKRLADLGHPTDDVLKMKGDELRDLVEAELAERATPNVEIFATAICPHCGESIRLSLKPE